MIIQAARDGEFRTEYSVQKPDLTLGTARVTAPARLVLESLVDGAHLVSMKTTTSTTTTASGLQPLMNIEELSEYLHVPVRTLYDWRLGGRGPCAVHVGRQLRYFVSDVHEWLAQQREHEPGRAPDGA